ncbi:hypothetical protein ACIPLC_35905 [Kitasatospora sp. NPDC086801]|uniref:hypothetical protein n=1 Tax=Kitasatospora sp. NPDC086801 TaxID=3364066 RepID=UPI003807FCE2
MSELDDLRMRLAALETEVDRLRKESAATRTRAAMADRGGAKAAKAAKARTSPRGRARVLDETRVVVEGETETGQAMTCLAEAVGVLGSGRVRSQVEAPQTQVLQTQALEAQALEAQALEAQARQAQVLPTETRQTETLRTEVPQALTPALEPQGRTLPQHGRFLESLLAGQSALFEEQRRSDAEQ